VRQLERELGTALFDRDARPVALTPAGEAMLAAARRSTTAADAAVDAARRAGSRRRLRLDISSGGIATGATIVRRLRRTAPGVAVEQVEVGVARGLELLRAGDLDAVLGLVEHPPPGVAVHPVRREPVLAGMAARHPLAAREAVPVAALEGVGLLLPSDEAAGEWVAFVQAFCRDAGFAPRRFDGATHGSVSAAELLREGRCVTPTCAWTEPLAGLVFRPLVDPVPVMPWSLALRSGDERTEVRALLRSVRETIRIENWLDV
jgi:DNA-binding transcriptional LysR family regulator